MNCQQVETLILEQARAQAQPLGTDALRHLDDCPQCAARLSAEQFVTAALSAVAAQDVAVAAPAHVEAALLAAFRAHAESAAHAANRTASPTHVQPLISRLWPRRAWLPLAIAAAVVLLVVAALRFTSHAPQRQTQTATVSAPTRPTIPAPQPQTVSAPPAEGRDRQEQIAAGAVPAQTDRHRRGGTVHVNHRQSAGPPRVLETTVGSVGEMVVVGHADVAESVTEFVPLVAGGAPPLTSGQLVRVELPRSAAASLGLPLDPARVGETIRADVLLGEDGLVRAIRLVR
ncbi:MAG: hypothetical protein ACJ74W_04460 [Pyrinomonadaceae bacterium]